MTKLSDSHTGRSSQSQKGKANVSGGHGRTGQDVHELLVKRSCQGLEAISSAPHGCGQAEQFQSVRNLPSDRGKDVQIQHLNLIS